MSVNGGVSRPAAVLESLIAVALDEFVPRNSFYRHSESTLVSSFDRGWMQELRVECCGLSLDLAVFSEP